MFSRAPHVKHFCLSYHNCHYRPQLLFSHGLHPRTPREADVFLPSEATLSPMILSRTPRGSFSNASLVGAKSVKWPSLPRVSSRSEVMAAAWNTNGLGYQEGGDSLPETFPRVRLLNYYFLVQPMESSPVYFKPLARKENLPIFLCNKIQQHVQSLNRRVL